MSYDIPPEQELEMGTPKPDARSGVTVRALTPEEDGTPCIGCARKIRFRPFESHRPKKIVAVLFGGALCCSQECVDAELGRRDIENQAEEDAAMHDAYPPEAPDQ